MHLSLKIVCNKVNGGGGILMFLKFLISLLKLYLPTAASFITASHTLTKRVLHSILMLRLLFSKSRLLSPFSVGIFSTHPAGRALWEESLVLSKIHSSIRADLWNFCPLHTPWAILKICSHQSYSLKCHRPEIFYCRFTETFLF